MARKAHLKAIAGLLRTKRRLNPHQCVGICGDLPTAKRALHALWLDPEKYRLPKITRRWTNSLEVYAYEI
jgi:hypothetical protein